MKFDRSDTNDTNDTNEINKINRINKTNKRNDFNKNDINKTKEEVISKNESFALLLIDFIDGNLSNEESYKVKEQLDSNDELKEIYSSLLYSSALSKKLVGNRNEFVNTLSNEYKNERKDKIYGILRAENENRRNFAVTKDINSSKSNRISILPLAFRNIIKKIDFSKNIHVYASTAAGFLIIISAIIIFSNNGFIKNNLSNIESRKGSQNLTKQDNNENPEGGKALISSNTAPALGSFTDQAEVKDTANNYNPCTNESALSSAISEKINDFSSWTIIAAKSVKTDVCNIISTSKYYLEIVNNDKTYLAVMCFPSNLINDKEKLLLDLQNKIVLPLKIEIISRENSQKLLEYTSEQNKAILENEALKNDAEFLVISIGR